LLLILLAGLLLPYLVVPFYRAGHPVSTLMAWRYMTGVPVSRQWIDFTAISPSLPRSVVAAEDAKFCSHHGIDWDALRDVIDDAEDGEVTRGGSTITQQVAKNLFLWPGRSFVRKALELPLALWIAAPRRDAAPGRVAIGFVVVAVLKALVYDSTHLQGPLRVTVFAAVGALLLAGARIIAHRERA